MYSAKNDILSIIELAMFHMKHEFSTTKIILIIDIIMNFFYY